MAVQSELPLIAAQGAGELPAQQDPLKRDAALHLQVSTHHMLRLAVGARKLLVTAASPSDRTFACDCSDSD